jgi:hypothetical protein
MTPQEHITETKMVRVDLDTTLQTLKLMSGQPVRGTARDAGQSRPSRERSIAVTKLQEAIMWLGMDLKAIDEENPGASPNPYPESYNPASPVVDRRRTD